MTILTYFAVGFLFAVVADSREPTDAEIDMLRRKLERHRALSGFDFHRGSQLYRLMLRLTTLAPIIGWPAIVVWKVYEKLQAVKAK